MGSWWTAAIDGPDVAIDGPQATIGWGRAARRCWLALRRRLTAALTATALVAGVALVGGCGVATETGVVMDGDGPRGQAEPGAPPREPPGREDAGMDHRAFITNYLKAASADPEVSMNRLREYLAPTAAPTWQPDPQVLIVRSIGDFRVTPVRGGGADVFVRLQPVGTFTEMSAVDPPPNRDIIEYTFKVQPGEPGQRGLFLTNPRPGQILLLDVALDAREQLYLPYPIYFWDNQDRTLVPDLRYLSLSIPEQQRPTEVVRWLLAGPSSLLRQTAHGLPAGTELRGGNVYKQDGQLMVNLSAKAAGVSPKLLLPQLRWSLWWLYSGKIGLLIEGQRAADDDATDLRQTANMAAALPERPEIMCVAGGVVVGDCDNSGAVAPPPALAAPENSGVVSAAVSMSPGLPIRSALVRAHGRTVRRLWIGQAPAGTATRPTFISTDLIATSMSRPVWLRVWGTRPSTQTGLIAAGGRLHRFVASMGPDRVERTELTVQVENVNVPLTGITAVAAAADARRIALIAGGRLYVAPLVVVDNTVTVGVARPLTTTLGDLKAVTFSAEDRLLVAGQDMSTGESWIAEVTIDGAIEHRDGHNLGLAKITQLVAYPDDPVNRSPRGSVLVEADGRASRVFGTSLQDIDNKTAPFYVE